MNVVDSTKASRGIDLGLKNYYLRFRWVENEVKITVQDSVVHTGCEILRRGYNRHLRKSLSVHANGTLLLALFSPFIFHRLFASGFAWVHIKIMK